VRLTVADLARYYVAVFPWIERYLHARPVVYERYPGTIDGPNTFEQDPPPEAPRWVKRVQIRGRERVVTYVLCENAATIVYLVSLHAVTLHVWESTTHAIECPDFLLFDLDPPEGVSVARLARVALRVAERLEALGLVPLVKTSGARGLHVVAPVRPEHTYEQVRGFERSFVGALARDFPDEITGVREPAKRPNGTVYVDWGQMGRGMTIAAPYTARPCPGAPVSMPLEWSEVRAFAKSRSKRPAMEVFARFSLRNVPAMLQTEGDRWAEAWHPQRFDVSVDS
jgi:bifunctional non-homologous end joining protein LigD